MLRSAYLVRPVSTDVAKPRFTWEFDSRVAFRQEYYQINIASEQSLFQDGKADVYQYGKIKSGDIFGCCPYQTIHETYGSFNCKGKVIGIVPIYRVFHKDMNAFTLELQNHLTQSQKYKESIFICLSSFVFDTAHPDMWNWWYESIHGHDPENINNVEWYV